MYIRFQADDVVPNQQETITRALFSNNDGNLQSFHTSSNQTDSQKAYYYEIYNSASIIPTSEPQFSVAFGHRFGSGSESEGGQVTDTPSRGIYSQYKQICLNPGVSAFDVNGQTTNYIYVLNFNRARIKDSLDANNIEINLHHLSGSEFIQSNPLNEHTGSNVTLGRVRALRLISDATLANPAYTTAGEVYNIVSGSIEDGIFNNTAPHYYGTLYPRLGIAVLSGEKLDISASFGTVTGSDTPGDNAFKLFTAISGAASLSDLSGDKLGMKARSKEFVKSTHYFVRAKAAQFNFSNNPTFVTGSDGDLAISDFVNDPKVYITTVGLYDENKNLLAVAKTSKPIQKSFRKETLIEVKLDY
jgi:hypothetical protein